MYRIKDAGYTSKDVISCYAGCGKTIRPWINCVDENELVKDVFLREFYKKGWTTQPIRGGHDYVAYCEDCSAIKDILE